MRRGRRQRLYLHIGLAKTGSTYLQDLLSANPDALTAHGYVFPHLGPGSMFRAAVEMAGRARRRGLSAEAIQGTFDEIVERGRRSGDTIVISHEIFSAMSPERVARVCERLQEFDLHVVVAVREPGRLLVASWQEKVKNGSSATFAEFMEPKVAARAPTGGPGEHEPSVQAELRDRMRTLLATWGAHVAPANLHVVVCPPGGGDQSMLWARFADAIGLDPEAVDPTSRTGRTTSANTSLGVEQIAFLRRLNEVLDGRFTPAGHARVVKGWFSRSVLGQVPGTRPTLPQEYVGPLDGVAHRWIDDVVASGASVHGDLAELRVRAPGHPADHPDAVTAEQEAFVGAVAVAEALLEVQRLRQEVRRLRHNG